MGDQTGPGPLVVLSLDFADGDLVRMSRNGVTTWADGTFAFPAGTGEKIREDNAQADREDYAAWLASPQYHGTMPRVRQSAFLAGFAAAREATPPAEPCPYETRYALHSNGMKCCDEGGAPAEAREQALLTALASAIEVADTGRSPDAERAEFHRLRAALPAERAQQRAMCRCGCGGPLTVVGHLDLLTGRPATIYTPPENLIIEAGGTP
jgi:hypothetical protein